MDIKFSARTAKVIVQIGLLSLQSSMAMALFDEGLAISALAGIIGIAFTIVARPAKSVWSLDRLDIFFLALMGGLAAMVLVDVIPRVVEYWSAKFA